MRRLAVATIVGVIVAAASLIGGPVKNVAATGAAIKGAGSTWSQIAIRQWTQDVAKNGLSVYYGGGGSSAGREFYMDATVDFAVSEIPFQPVSFDRLGNKLPDEISRAAKRPYAYMPIVAGGTSFMYHLDVNGKRITDLHLSGATIAKIFTGKITNWNDPAITADDGRHFPSLPIHPIVRSDGSGTSAQFTLYMLKMFPDIWNPFCTKYTNLPAPCPLQSLYPYFPGSQAQNGSDGVSQFVAAPYNNGAITYVEYGYALAQRFPVVSVENQAGYFRQPTAENVAIALTKARLNPDRTQVLDDVYRNPDPRAYPISSYSYMIVPISDAAPMSPDKGATLGQFILYFLCTGQQKAKPLGYSPLPANLVGFGFDAESRIPGAPKPPPVDAAHCANPTITGDFGFGNVPPPPASDRAGAVRPGITGTNGSGSSADNGSSAGASDANLQAADAGANGNAADATGAADSGSGGSGTNSSLQATPVATKNPGDDVPLGIYVAVALVVVLALFVPPGLYLLLRKRE
jgi:phosphate transport system substrate-binding protein